MRTRSRTPASASAHRISGPDELVQAIPYLLGFHPERSLVLVGLHERQLVVTARLDLAGAYDAGTLEHTIAAMVRGGTSAVVAAIWDDHEGAGDVRPLPRSDLVEPLTQQVRRSGCDLLDIVLVSGERWWSLVCTVAECCPPEGRELPAAPSAFAAAATYEGRAVLADRRALEAVLEPRPVGERQLIGELIAAEEDAAMRAADEGQAKRFQRSVKRAIFAAARAADAPEGWAVSDADVARFGAALAAAAVRDPVWLGVDDGRLDGRPLWCELARRLPTPYDAPALFLYGWASWRAGEGTMAGIAVERALASDPRYTAADLLMAALSGGVDPRQFPTLRRPA